ncbi:hypothetical protein DTO013E5_4544 [Penicillium roqueforti]|uniref:Xylose isomerase-like, TIM barrel domain n=1 Tax=Penicillium roqueforti (strain FM164) TaxID=1365484 RepID=W6PTX4_PENRF|nr:uncharacterized protein LCP9604111_8782 [Penicillium roqueforti]CDM27221.1 Xylose isomerase-like, TIM barrel domain [Penicillium roqueforti FM164]KAF9240304.1 hypothetical protein LCP9604111_8782 [Penicillium roqueforti]KAI1835323.1 hypothetical protein CBS147337_4140 [Penicillium roqueforti]KAI2677336.1 hypothetical protein CBS147355_5563 [Penicillium roqueforti]KAI2688367.1 hypothetical protein LCP963914a_2769 [Penicillium roqueforti]
MTSIKVAIASNSLGKSTSGHTLLHKLETAKLHGFDGVEVAIECLEAHASSFSQSSRASRLRAAATHVDQKAQDLSLSLIALNPFGAYDGLVNPVEVESRLEEAELWFDLCRLMRIPIFQITSCLYPIDPVRITPEVTTIAANMKRLGLLAQKYGLLVGYEAPAWGTHLNTWQQIHEIIKLVDLPNVCHCLDTFHISAKEAGDPFSAVAPIRPGGLANLRRSLEEMKRTVTPNQIAYFQLSDAMVADQGQVGYQRRDLNQPPYMTQSRNCRIFPCEANRGGVLPVLEVAQAVFDLGYTGWVSMEVFHTDMWNTRSSVPDDWAQRGMASWREISFHCGLDRHTNGRL